jgi:hypothetical protein
MVKVNKNLCWVSDQTGATTELTEDEVIAMYNKLQDDNKALCEENEELKEQLEQLKAANGKAVKALRKSGVTIQKLQDELKEDQPVDHTQYCRSCQQQCTDAKAMLNQLDLYKDHGDSPVLQGIRMELTRMSGVCEDKKKFNEQFKNTVERYGNARGVCPQ